MPNNTTPQPMETKHTQQVDFSNPNADKITSASTTTKPMDTKKQTAVEWLVDNLHYLHSTKWNDIVEQAKAMEKQQIINAYENGEDRSAELYYLATYEK